MDIICGKCGRHLNSVEAAREHSRKHAEESNSEPIRWVPARHSKISPEEWDNLIKLINTPSGYVNNNKTSGEGKAVELSLTQEICPKCKKNLYYDSQSSLWRCKECKHIYTYDDLHKKQAPSMATTDSKQEDNAIDKGKEKTHKHNVIKKTTNNIIPKWLIALLFVFTFIIIGLGVSLFAGNPIPLWLLFGFSFFYSIGKWFNYVTQKNKGIGKVYKLLLNLSILAVLGLLIWSGIQLFSQHFFKSAITGSITFIAEFILFIWMCRVVAKNSWRWPSMKLTIFSLIILFLVFAFAGVQPIKSYKDNTFSHIESFFSNLSQAME